MIMAPATGAEARTAAGVYDQAFGKFKQRGSVLGMGGNPSSRIVSTGPMGLIAVAFALLIMLALAGSAQARGHANTGAPLDTVTQSVAAAADAVSEPPLATEAPEASGTPSPPEEKAPEAPALPPEEKAAEAPPVAPPEEKAPEAPAVTPPVESPPEVVTTPP